MSVHRIPLDNTVFEGANNVYLADGPDTVLIDTGVAVPETKAALEAGLATYDRTFADVDAIVLTHYHADHAGLAGAIQAESGATVYAHEADAPLIAGDEAAWATLEATQRDHFESWGMPKAAREELLAFLEAGEEAGIYGDPVDVTPIQDGDTLSFDGLELTTHHAPGHTAGLCCFSPADRPRELYTGDALLPEYTPNVGGADVRLEGALGAYIETLEWLIEAGFDRAWPGHRDPIAEPTARAKYILSHHEERSYRVAEALATDGPGDAWTVSARLFGDLSNIHILHGPGEAFAHLEHLRAAGAVTRRDDGGSAKGGGDGERDTSDGGDGHQYALTEHGRTTLESVTDGRWPLSELV